MVLTRKTAHKIQNELQLIMSYVELDEKEKAKNTIRALSIYINNNIKDELEKPKEKKNGKKDS